MKRWDSLQNPLWFMMIHGGFMICNYHVATVGRRSGAIPSRSEEITMNAQENQHPPAVAGRGRRTVRGGLVAVIVGVLAGGALATFEPAVAQGPPGGPGGGFRGGPGGGPGARPFPPPRDGGRSWMPPPGSRGVGGIIHRAITADAGLITGITGAGFGPRFGCRFHFITRLGRRPIPITGTNLIISTNPITGMSLIRRNLGLGHQPMAGTASEGFPRL